MALDARDLGEAAAWILEVVDHAAAAIESEHDRVALRPGLQALGEARQDFPHERVGHEEIDQRIPGRHEREPENPAAVR